MLLKHKIIQRSVIWFSYLVTCKMSCQRWIFQHGCSTFEALSPNQPNYFCPNSTQTLIVFSKSLKSKCAQIKNCWFDDHLFFTVTKNWIDHIATIDSHHFQMKWFLMSCPAITYQMANWHTNSRKLLQMLLLVILDVNEQKTRNWSEIIISNINAFQLAFSSV